MLTVTSKFKLLRRRQNSPQRHYLCIIYKDQ